MQRTLHGIVLRTVKHSDTKTIVSAWTRESGRVSIALATGTSRESTRRRAIMMPLGMFEGVANIRSGNDMITIGDLRPYRSGNVSSLSPVKNLISVFIADFLNNVLRESQPDEHMTDFIFDTVDYLSVATGTALANLHLYVVYTMGHYIGITPDTGTYARGRYFDMREGVFVSTPPMHKSYLDQESSKMLYLLSVTSRDDLGLLRLSHDTRNSILDTMLEYYSLHHTNMSNMSSLQIIRMI